MQNNESYSLVEAAYRALVEKKGINIKVIDISEISDVTDYFIVASGSNINQVQALADNVSFALHEAGYNNPRIEGFRQAGWILLDYGDVVIHIFNHDDRIYYDIERIWRDGYIVEI